MGLLPSLGYWGSIVVLGGGRGTEMAKNRAGATFPLDKLSALTPLYGFSSDSEDLTVGEFRLVKYRSDSLPPVAEGDDLIKHFGLHEPDYLVWQRTPAHRTDLLVKLAKALVSVEEEGGLERIVAAVDPVFFSPANNFFRLLRLFKPGRLVAGDTFVSPFLAGVWSTAVSKRCSEVDIDYTLLGTESGSYTLLSSEIPFFDLFCSALLPQLQLLQEAGDLDTHSSLGIALLLFNEDAADTRKAVLNSLTALEALLIHESNAELGYRLSLRLANLLEPDDASRLNLFREIKEFYDLRSRIVHGSTSKLSPKLQHRAENVNSLREVLRKAILSVMALSSGANPPKIPLDELLDQIVFDEVKRKEIQRLAGKFLHLEGNPPYTIH
jgi:Apea-like HEPN